MKAVTDLPEPELAHDADDFARPDGQADVLDREGAVGALGQPHREIADLEHRGARRALAPRDRRARHPRIVRAIRGSSVSRRPSPTMFTASTVTASMAPGKKMIHGVSWK